MTYINWFFISSLILAVSTLSISFVIYRYGKDPAHKSLLYSYISLLVWSINATLISITLNPKISEIFWRIGCSGVTFTAVFFLRLEMNLTKFSFKKILFFAYTLGSFCTLLILKTDLIIKLPMNNFFKNYLIPTPGPLYFPWFICWCLVAGLSNFYLIKYYLTSQDVKNKSYAKSIIIFFSPGFVFGAFNFLGPFGFPPSQIANLGVSLYVLILTYFVFKNQLIGIEIAYKKGLLYSILIASLTGIYLLLIIIVEHLFRGIFGYKSFVVSLPSAFVIALLFNPLRSKIQEVIDKIFLGKTSQEIASENELLKQELERSEKLKTASTLALGLAHEIKNPLTTIKTFAEYLPEKYKDDEFVSKFSKIIPSEVERINSIIKQLLDFSKPSPPTFKETNICGLIQDTVKFLNSELLRHKIEIAESFENTKIFVKIDPSQIRQVILNLLFNAIDALPEGGRIEIKTKTLINDQIVIEISDNGPGIPKENLARIFDPFFTTKDEGTGLGLSICHQIIKNHKGLIEVKSEIGKGTTFIIKLPLVG